MVPSHKCVEATGGRVVPAIGEHPFEFRTRFDRGRERISSVELQRALKPAAQRGGQRLFLATGVRGHRRAEDFTDSRRILIVAQRAPKNQRERDDADLGDVGKTVEARQTLSLIHISEPTRLLSISYAVFCLKKKKK